MQGNQIAVVINGQVVGSARDSLYISGNVGLRVGAWQNVEFDNVAATPTGPAPRLVPQGEMTITATSEHDLFYRGDSYPAEYAIDGRPESLWHARFDPTAPLPQSVTLDLGSVREIEGLVYQPRIDNLRNGMITRYNIDVSADGLNFVRVVADGKWSISTGTKTIAWPAQEARFVRLEAVDAWNGNASAAEINVIAAAAASDFNADGNVDGADFLAWQRGMGKIGNAVSADGDADSDLNVDGTDLSIWKNQFNAASSGLSDVAAVDATVSASLAGLLPRNGLCPNNSVTPQVAAIALDRCRHRLRFSRIFWAKPTECLVGSDGNRRKLRWRIED